MEQRKIFITGTDTDVGKTLITQSLIQLFQNQNKTTVAIKPVAAGCEILNDQLINDDALKMIEVMDGSPSYSKVNPIALELAIAPHIAAEKSGQYLSVNTLSEKCNLSQFEKEIIIVEGAGGWLVPLNQTETFADWVEVEKLDVVLVVGIKLGCINHALLTVENIERRGLNLIGWVSNCVDHEMSCLDENVDTLKGMIDAPMIAKIPFLMNKNKIAIEHFNDSFFD